MKTKTSLTINPINQSSRHCGMVAGFLVALVLALTWLTLAPKAGAQCPQMCSDTTGNTALGFGALVSISTGADNTAIGFDALFADTTGGFNTAVGFRALNLNTTGFQNTAMGLDALQQNTTGSNNTAIGDGAMDHNDMGSNNTAIGEGAAVVNSTGNDNTAVGFNALLSNSTSNDNTAVGSNALINTTGSNNTATGFQALAGNTTLNNNTGNNNTGTGFQALAGNTTGNNNTASGFDALTSNRAGNSNTATGALALSGNTGGDNNTATGHNALLNNTSGSFNIALGAEAGGNLTTGSNNIDIANRGVAGEADTIRIGTRERHTNTFIAGINGVTVAGGVGVIIDNNGQLGTVVSSERFKDAIKPMDKASEAILALKPVTFRYKKELDPKAIPQFGLVAEEVDKVNPDLVARDEQGKPYTVRYDAVNAMLLNEFLKEHRKVEQMQKQIEALTAGLQKVSAQLEMSKPAPQTVQNGQ
jgi:hypothetical protein